MLSRFDTLGAKLGAFTVGQSRPLEIGLFAGFAGWVKLGGSDAIGVAAADNRAFVASGTDFHNW